MSLLKQRHGAAPSSGSAPLVAVPTPWGLWHGSVLPLWKEPLGAELARGPADFPIPLST